MLTVFARLAVFCLLRTLKCWRGVVGLAEGSRAQGLEDRGGGLTCPRLARYTLLGPGALWVLGMPAAPGGSTRNSRGSYGSLGPKMGPTAPRAADGQPAGPARSSLLF